MLVAATPKYLFTCACVITFPIYVTNALEKKPIFVWHPGLFNLFTIPFFVKWLRLCCWFTSILCNRWLVMGFENYSFLEHLSIDCFSISSNGSSQRRTWTNWRETLGKERNHFRGSNEIMGDRFDVSIEEQILHAFHNRLYLSYILYRSTIMVWTIISWKCAWCTWWTSSRRIRRWHWERWVSVHNADWFSLFWNWSSIHNYLQCWIYIWSYIERSWHLWPHSW